MDNAENISGIAASVLTAAASLPQLIKILKEKKSGDISIGMLLVLLTGLACWIYYGILKNDRILIIANSFSFLLNTALLILSVIFKERSE